MNIKPICLLAASILLGSVQIQAQENQTVWSLQQCIEYALANNLAVKQKLLNVELNENNLQTKKLSLAPSVNGQSQYRIDFGRAPVGSAFEYVDQTVHNGTLGLNADLPLFQGFTRINDIKKQRFELSAAIHDVEKTRNDIVLTLTSFYLQVLFDKELLAVGKSQLEVTRLQIDRSQKLVDAGSIPYGNLLEIKSQAAKEALSVTTQENNLTISLLNLAQLLDLQDVRNFDILYPSLPEIPLMLSLDVENVYALAAGTMPQIKREESRLHSSEQDLRMAKGALYPSLSLGGGWGSRVSYLKGADDFDFGKSFRENTYSYVGLTLSVPIFNALGARAGVKNARLGIQSAQYSLSAEKLALRKEIQQAYADAQNAYKKYLSAKEAVVSFEESFGYTQKKYDVGMVISVDYNTAKNDLTRSQSELLQSKYEYILRTKILDFYMGNPIQL